ncbi:TIGR04140 family protein [Pyrococcus sp. ST04]|uniref:TIGR04140 family protein n=1 Tax=Pyrococcus sp. ST04 TaxID=1183377 RepID=UPI0002605DD4|nr:TIGR04140 family protein [Pyrococcus sp. ST04]AFK23139.1 hypothetical protein Py04_1568 [Pyrococcus sp. ST04]
MIIETPIPIKELEDIKRKSKANVIVFLVEKVERNGIILNRVQILGPKEEIEKFINTLKLARAGG